MLLNVVLFDGPESGLLHYFAQRQAITFALAGLLIGSLIFLGAALLDRITRRQATKDNRPRRLDKDTSELSEVKAGPERVVGEKVSNKS